MLIGVPQEVKDHEYRVAITPAGVCELVKDGHRILVQAKAGLGSGISDQEYLEAGAEILSEASEVFDRSELILKVKEPVVEEYHLFREDQILFTFLHLASLPALTEALINRHVTAIAYETVEAPDGALPILIPMSEIAGCMSIMVGAQFQQKTYGGAGVLLGGLPGVLPAKVVILGGGTVGLNAARMAVGLGAEVTLLDVNLERLRYLDHLFLGRLRTLVSNSLNIKKALIQTDLLIGAVLIRGSRAPILVTEEMVHSMPEGSVIVDVAVDQGGCVETIRPTTHSHPTYVVGGVVHYGVSNMPGAVPRTATFALANTTFPYVRLLASKGFERAVQEHPGLAKGVNIFQGEITCKGVAEAFKMEYVPLQRLLKGTFHYSGYDKDSLQKVTR